MSENLLEIFFSRTVRLWEPLHVVLNIFFCEFSSFISVLAFSLCKTFIKSKIYYLMILFLTTIYYYSSSWLYDLKDSLTWFSQISSNFVIHSTVTTWIKIRIKYTLIRIINWIMHLFSVVLCFTYFGLVLFLVNTTVGFKSTLQIFINDISSVFRGSILIGVYLT